MLNYIWAGLIIISIVFATGNDIRDEINNTYQNGLTIEAFYTADSSSENITLHYNTHNIRARINENEIIFVVDDTIPNEWHVVAEYQASNNKQLLRCVLINHDRATKRLSFTLPEVHWIKLKAITQAAFDMAEFAVKLAIGLAGIMALWLGLMQIAEKSGLILIFVRAIHPLLRWLFPDIPKDHPALGSISLNLAANVLGLGNAATPLGIKAMQQLQTLNEKKDRASNAMCMFLALNTSSVQLLPPVTLIALMGTQVSELIVPIILATLCSTIAAIIAVKLFVKAGH